MSAVRTASIAPPSQAPEPVFAAPAPALVIAPEVTPEIARAAAAPATPAPARKATARRPGGAPVYLAAVVLFVGISAMLSGRMLAGEDPALGLSVRPLSAAVVPVTPPQRKVIVTRRIRIDGLTPRQIRRRAVDQIVIVHRRAPAASGGTVASAGDGSPGAPAPVSSGAGTTTTESPRRSTSRTSGGSDPAPSSSDPAVTTPAPSTTTPAPAAAPQATAPVQQTAPAPAPTPAPVATGTS